LDDEVSVISSVVSENSLLRDAEKADWYVKQQARKLYTNRFSGASKKFASEGWHAEYDPSKPAN
jgi:hypothetical protein